jgi:uncharacterized protein GlcG (DUF336 family)
MIQALTLKQTQKIIQAAMTKGHELNLASLTVVLLDDG